MTLLDVGGAGLFSHSGTLLHVLGMAFKLIAGSFMILVSAFFSLIGIVVYSIYKGYQTSSVLQGARTLIRLVAYAIGASVALVFALVAGLFFSIATAKLLFVTVLIAFAVSFVVRETFLFIVLKRFGKYVMYFTALQLIKEKVYNHGEQENQP
jgi:hypothetical protein